MNTDYIKYHGTITNIRENVDKNYIWFDICQKQTYKDTNGTDRTNLSFFSARINKNTKPNLKLKEEIYVEGIPKGYVDKNGFRQNYIHVENLSKKEKQPTYNNEYWNNQKIEPNYVSKEVQKEFERKLKILRGDINE